MATIYRETSRHYFIAAALPRDPRDRLWEGPQSGGGQEAYLCLHDVRRGDLLELHDRLLDFL